MNFLALNDDVKFIIASHLQSDRKINKIFMNESDDNLQKHLFGEVKEMSLDIEEVCIDLVNDNKKFDDEIEFFKKNYNKIYTDSKCFYESKKRISRARQRAMLMSRVAPRVGPRGRKKK